MKDETTNSLFDIVNIKVEQNPDIGDNMAKITLIGIGGGGCNMIDNYCSKNKYKIKIIASNTDNQVLNKSIAPVKLQLGVKTTNGLGAGMNPEIGRKAALENSQDIKNMLNGSDMVFLCAGLGGGTGSGSIPVIAQIAKEMGILCFCVVTIPFGYEIGRDVIASNALQELIPYADSYMVIYNDKILYIVSEGTGVQESFKIIDDVLYEVVNGMCEIILNYQRLNINIDFADISTTLTKKGLALIGIGRQKGPDSAKNAFIEAVNSPLLNINSIEQCKSVIIHFTFHPKFPIHKMSEIMNYVKNSADIGARCIIGTVYDEDMQDDEVKVIIIATGFENKRLDEKKIEHLKIKEEQKEEIEKISWFDKFIAKWF